jgi:hypothetical protein
MAKSGQMAIKVAMLPLRTWCAERRTWCAERWSSICDRMSASGTSGGTPNCRVNTSKRRPSIGGRSPSAAGLGLAKLHTKLHLTEDGVPKVINEEDWVKYIGKASVLFPVAPRKFKWDIFMLAIILYSAVTVPFRLAMDHAAEDSWWTLEVAISLCFLTDMALNFRTAYVDGDQYVLDKTMIRNA